MNCNQAGTGGTATFFAATDCTGASAPHEFLDNTCTAGIAELPNQSVILDCSAPAGASATPSPHPANGSPAATPTRSPNGPGNGAASMGVAGLTAGAAVTIALFAWAGARPAL